MACPERWRTFRRSWEGGNSRGVLSGNIPHLETVGARRYVLPKTAEDNLRDPASDGCISAVRHGLAQITRLIKILDINVDLVLLGVALVFEIGACSPPCPCGAWFLSPRYYISILHLQGHASAGTIYIAPQCHGVELHISNIRHHSTHLMWENGCPVIHNTTANKSAHDGTLPPCFFCILEYHIVVHFPPFTELST